MMVTLDPMKKFEDVKKDRLVAACGLLPAFFADAMDRSTEDTAESVYKAVVEVYGFGDYSSANWGTVTPEGAYVSAYDDDPDMYPLLLLEYPDSPVQMLIYQSAILAVRDGETTILSRMD